MALCFFFLSFFIQAGKTTQRGVLQEFNQSARVGRKEQKKASFLATQPQKMLERGHDKFMFYLAVCRHAC
jgi:hypothetical protein